MKKMGTRNLLFAMMAILAIGGWIFGCNDEENQSTTVPDSHGNPGNLKGSISGLVIDVKNQPVSDASVYLSYPGGSSDVKTNAGGRYLLANVPVAGELVTSGASVTPNPGSPYLITVSKDDFATAFTAARLDYATLQWQGVIEIGEGGVVQVVGDLMVEAVAAVMGKPTAVVTGKVINQQTAQPLEGVLVSLSGVPIPNAEQIWNNGAQGTPCSSATVSWGVGASTWAFPDNTGTTLANGEFTILTVVERTDACPWSYTITYSLAGFVPQNVGKTISVGFGEGIIYVVDAVNSDPDPATPLAMLPGGPVLDDVAPSVVSTNIPVGGEIGYSNREGDLLITFNEPMQKDTGNAYLDARDFKAPGPIALVESWDEAGQVLTLNPTVILPEGMRFTVELTNLIDDAGNAYTGLLRSGTHPVPDALTMYNPAVLPPALHGGILAFFLTSGNPTLLQATAFQQTLAAVNPAQPIGGKSGSVPQINNQNFLNIHSHIPGLPILIGSAINQADTFTFDWTAADGNPRQYNIYCEYRSGGFDAGLPVLVKQTAKSGDPETTLSVNLTTINGAQAALPLRVDTDNLTNAGAATLNFVNDGFNMNFALTTVNTDAAEGAFTMERVSAGDNVPPTVRDQDTDWGFDMTGLAGPTVAPMVPINGVAATGLPVFVLTSGVAGSEIDLTVLDAISGLAPDGRYNQSDWAAFSAVGTSTITVGMSEDLDGSQTVPDAVLTTDSAADATATTILGVGNDLKAVQVTLSGVPLIQPGDTLSFAGLLDEAGNAAEADATLIFADMVEPLIVSGRVNDNGAAADTIVLAFTEPLERVSAETETNYALPIAAPTQATLSVDGMTVTLCRDNDPILDGVCNDGAFARVTPGITNANLIKALVDDLVGNTGGTLFFQLTDTIAPRILSAQTAGGGINLVAAGAAADGRWDVADGAGIAELYTIYITFSEPVVDANADGDPALTVDDLPSGVNIACLPAVTYFGEEKIDPFSATALVFRFSKPVGQVVAAGDSCRVVGVQDLALPANAVNLGFDAIVLNAALGGYDPD